MQKVKKKAKLGLISIITGLLVGLFVGLYQFALPYIVDFAKGVFASREWRVISLNTVSIVLLSFINFYLIRFSPSIDSSGIISINISLVNREEIPYKKEIPSMICNSFISSYVLFPLGSEGPSITLAGKTAKGVNDLFKEEDEDNIKIAFGAGFGAAFISPIGGLFYAFEEELHKVNFGLIIRTILTMSSMFLVVYFLNNHHALYVADLNVLPIEQSGVLLLILLAIIFVAFIYLLVIKEIKLFYLKHENNFIIEYRGFFLFGLMLILGYLLTPLMGAGNSLINLSYTCGTWYALLLIIVFRIFITSIAGNGKVSGGLIIPSLAIGAMLGSMIALIFENNFGFEFMYRGYIVLLSMCMFFAYITEAPLTAITLFFSNLIYSSGTFNVFNKSTMLGGALIFSVFLVTKIFKVVPLYDMLVEINLNHTKKLKEVKIIK